MWVGCLFNLVITIEFELWRCQDFIPWSKTFCGILLGLTSPVETEQPVEGKPGGIPVNKISDTPNRLCLLATREESKQDTEVFLFLKNKICFTLKLLAFCRKKLE